MSSILCAMAGTALGLVGVCRWGKKLMIRQELKSHSVLTGMHSVRTPRLQC